MDKRADRGQATRARIVDVATRLFAEQGYDAVTIPMVLAEAGVSRGALYHHFESKEALFEAVLDAVETNLAQRSTDIGEITDPVEAIRRGFSDFLQLAGRDRVVQQVLLIDAPAVIGWERWRAMDEQYVFGVVKAVVQAAADEGLVPADHVDPLSHVLLASLNELALLVARAAHPRRAAREALAAVDLLLDRLFVTAS